MIVGLTGGIGSGKSAVAKMFSNLGVPVYESDRQAKRLMQSSKKLRKAIIGLLGSEAYNEKKLNRPHIAKMVFDNPARLSKLNAIVHPAVRKHFLKWAKKKESPYVIQETAIMFENGLQDFYDKVILITAPKELRLQRILKRDQTSKEDILTRMGAQWDDAKKIPLSDFVIENVDLEKTKSKIEDLHKRLLEYS